ncbi:hypothetical protein Taro_010891 [Colocasia esculenta]|uniref:IST1-like protein n=1 Tax=Colocasia esculenta TaxID=4460 RepID=A0A843U918_COLES|nr:hypothetical protein [Colocasia esculenta]
MADAARCSKQAIKRIDERLKVIRKRKQAMLNFLRQDIADLLRDGHDSNALNRSFGEFLKAAPWLQGFNYNQKVDVLLYCVGSFMGHGGERGTYAHQYIRECPAEDKEAVSTLIFAAARFSDLPELCDLRHTFMSRYGSAMETSVRLEFIEILASRTFSMATKIQLMQKIAQEFSVEWVSGSLEYGSSDSVASQCVNEKDGEKSDGMCQYPINTDKDVVADTKDILVIGLEPEPTRGSKICDDELENVNPYAPDSSIPHYVHPKRDKDGRYMSPRAREVLDPTDQEGKVLDEKFKDGPRDGRKDPLLWNGEAGGVGEEYWHDDHTIHSRSSRAQGKLEGGIDRNGDVFYENDTDSMRSPKNQMHHNSEMRHAIGQYKFKKEDKSIRAHLIRPEAIEDAIDSDDYRKPAAGRDEFEDNVKPVKIPHAYVKSRAVKDAFHSDDWDRDEIPPKESSGKDADIAAQERQMDGPWKSNHEITFHMIPPPPYVKPKVRAIVDHFDSSSPPTNDGGFTARHKSSTGGNKDPQRDELVVDHERQKPRSVRRNKKSPVAQDSEDAVGSDEPMRGIQRGQRRHVARKNIFPRQDDYDSEEEDIDRLLMHYSKKKTPQQFRKHREKTDAHLADHARDRCGVDQHQTPEIYNESNLESPQTRFVEHVAGDKAVMHQTDSGQYIDMHDSHDRDPIGKPGSPAQSLSVEHMNRGETRRHLIYHSHHVDTPELVHPHERAASFPPDPLAVEKVERPARVTSMQPDALSPSGGHAHPNLPEYEEFAARFAALRRG